MPRHEAVQKKKIPAWQQKKISCTLCMTLEVFANYNPKSHLKLCRTFFVKPGNFFCRNLTFKWFGAQFFFEFSLTQKRKRKIFTSFVDHSCICFLTLDWKVAKSKKVFIFIFPPNLKKTCTKSLYIQLFQLCKYF